MNYDPFIVEALANDELIHGVAAVVGCRAPSALAYGAAIGPGKDC